MVVLDKKISPNSEIYGEENMPKTLLIDLDGVLNTYHGDYDEFIISPPRSGVYEFLRELSLRYKIIIFTARDKILSQKWLKKYNLDGFVDEVTNIKSPFANIIIDDRALRFNGNYEETLKEIEGFEPFWKEQ